MGDRHPLNKKNMTENTLTGFQNEGENPFATESENENDNSSESSTEETNTDQTQSQEGEEDSGEDKNKGGEGEKNLNDHPRWKEREKNWDKRFNEQEVRHTEEVNKLREDFTPKEDKKPTSTDVPSWFGGDENQWAEFQAYQDQNNSKAEENALNKIKQIGEAEQKAVEDATTYLNEQVEDIQSNQEVNPDGLKVDKNKLLKFTMDNELVDMQGRWNYKAAFKMMKAGVVNAKNKSIDEKKVVAGATTSESRAETKKENVTTSEDFSKAENRPW